MNDPEGRWEEQFEERRSRSGLFRSGTQISQWEYPIGRWLSQLGPGGRVPTWRDINVGITGKQIVLKATE